MRGTRIVGQGKRGGLQHGKAVDGGNGCRSHGWASAKVRGMMNDEWMGCFRLGVGLRWDF